jgi:tRNA(fMet)-specific endonuclease VapC
MIYLLDTNTCVFLIRKKSPVVLQNLTRHALTTIAISALTVAELQYGVEKSAAPRQNQAALDSFLLPFTLLPFDDGDAVVYGTIRSYLEVQGTPIGAIDTLLAAQALRAGLIVVTNNVREFERVPGLQIEDWTKPHEPPIIP